ncbi:MAG: TRAP transporter large permease [Candidatus Atribacteria bacterium]|nr:MAG: TRAP transporter large permease [Candidatus Atribacteria bacterium]
MSILLLFAIMFLLMILGVAIVICMGIASFVYLLVTGNAPLTLVSTSMINGITNSSLLAIPFFILAGELMNISGMTLRVVKFARFFIGKWKGGLSYTCVIVNIIAAGVSGSAPADCSAVSSVLLPVMKEEGYPEEFSAAINASAATIGPIIPPSIPMVFIGLLTNLSVGRLFLGGVIPRFLMGAGLMLVCYFKVKKMNLGIYEQEQSFKIFLEVLKDSFLALIAPFVIILGVITGLVTITEVAILSTSYIFFVGIFVYKTIAIKDILNIFKNSIFFSSSIMALFSVAGIFAWFIAVEGLGKQLGAYVLSMNMSPFLFIVFVNLLFVFLGMIMSAIAAMLIFVPVLLPIAIALGIDPIFMSVVIVLNLMIGLLTPPVGGLLYLEAKIANVPVDKLIKELIPFILILFGVVVLMILFPPLVTFIPNLLF